MDVTAKTKITDFNVRKLVNEDVFRFEISVSNAKGVAVLDRLCNFAENEGSGWFVKFVIFANKVEKLPAPAKV